MSTINKDDFLAALRKSNVLSPEVLQAWLDKNPTSDGPQTVLHLSKAGLITRWQAKYLMSGRHLLKIGNYVLLERISQDELGDLFIANHESLDRKVLIQFLPTELNADKAKVDRFLQRVGIASELDHKNLVHLYDVDQEKGRYYLITEFYSGETLDSLAGQLNSEKLANILLQASDALDFVHQNKLFHGCVTERDIVVSDDNEVKLKGLALAVLRSDNWDGGSATSDFAQLGHVAVEAFRQLPMTEQTGRLESIIANIGSEFSNPADIRQGLLGYLNHASQATPANAIPEGISLDSVTDQPHDSPGAVDMASLSGVSNPQSASQGNGKGGNKAALILGAAVVGCLAVLGATIFIAMYLTAGPEVAKSNPFKASTSSRASKERNPVDELQGGILERDDASLTEEPAQPATNEPAQPATNEPAKPATNEPAKPATNEPVKPATNEPAKPATNEPVKPATNEPVKPATNEPAKPATNELVKPATNEPVQTAPAGSPGGANARKTANKPKPAPFVNLPAHFDLPINTEQQAVSLGKIKPDSKYLLGVKLISGPEISKSKISFELKANHPEDKKTRQWDVLYKQRESDAGEPVAKFINQGNDFRFQWHPSAAEDENVNYLRNCVVKFEMGSNRDERVLRSPFLIADFKFGADNPQVKVDLELDWLPDPKYITTQLGEMPEKQYGKNFFENGVITKKVPVRIAFSDIPYEQMCWIEVTADVKTKVKLAAALQLPSGNRPKLAKPSLFESAANTLQQNANFKNEQYKQFHATPIANLRKLPAYKSITDPQKRKMAGDLKSAADVASEQRVQFLAQKTNSIDKFYDKVIPITISYKLGDREIPLATTTAGK